MIVGERGDVEAVLFWVGACAFFLCDPFLSAYLFHDFVPRFKGLDRTPGEIAVMGAEVNGLFMLFPGNAGPARFVFDRVRAGACRDRGGGVRAQRE